MLITLLSNFLIMHEIKSTSPDTLCSHLGRGDNPRSGFVNPPTTRGSTKLYPTLQQFIDAGPDKLDPTKTQYGIYGTETTRELEKLLAVLDGAYASMVMPSGLNAITTSLLAFLKNGDHILVPDNVYEPTRKFCDNLLKHLGINTTYYPPDLDINIADYLQENTRVLYVEAPGSLTMEVPDLAKFIKIARDRNITSILDNTWATSINYPAIENGFNVSIQAGTKYIGGHSDIMLGVITCDEAHWLPLRHCYDLLGSSPGSEETTLALRGLRSMPTRLRTHARSAMKVATWLEQQPAVSRVFYPALESSPSFANFTANFKGATGLLSFELHPCSKQALHRFVDGLNYFGIGASWGGYESLISAGNPASRRTVSHWPADRPAVRLSIGLEDVDDLIDDLDQGLARLND